MVYGLSLRVSWISLLLFSNSACFPAPKDYRYAYTATWGSGGGTAPESNIQSKGSRPPLVNLQYGPSANYQHPEADPQQASSPTGNQSPSRVRAPSVAAGLSPSYEPNSFIVSYDSSSNKPASTLSQDAGYFSPTARPLLPTGTRKKTPSFSVQSQYVAGTSGNANMDSSESASDPVYQASPAYPAGGDMDTTLDFGAGPVPYNGAPATYTYNAGSYPYANKHPATQGTEQRSLNTAATGWLDDRSFPYGEAPTSFRFGAETYATAPVTYNFGDGAASQGAGYVSPTAHPLPRTGTPSFSLQSQSVAGTSGNSNMDSSVAASAAGNIVTTLDLGDGPVSYISAPATYTHNAGSYPYANKHPATQGGQAGRNTATPGKLYDGPVSYWYPYAATPATYNSGDGAASQGVGYIRPTTHTLPRTGKKTPSFSVQSQFVAGTSGNSQMGFGGGASGPVYRASPAYPAAGNMATTLDFDGPVPYIGAPATYTYNAGSYPYANKHPATQGGQTSRNTAANGGLEGPIPYGSAPTSFRFGVAPFPNPAPATSNYVDGAGSAPGLPWALQPEEETDSLFPDFDISAFESQTLLSESEIPLPPPSSYIIPSRNGYQQALEALSPSKHSPEYSEPPVFASKTPPVIESKGVKNIQ
ncbi:nuclear envelope pore membrane protein POM 121-like [Sander lucioperca]|uniref:nuclear envelope pore membrane protein POM 121-like n=1 Tax=Sander lucioperca TaxID=283035 RepID=UPI00125E6F5B|nr:nuclear envelope pore membrane protein POM 121-like [Sander lucioperca]